MHDRDALWTMRDGQKIALKDMKTSHIENSLNMLKRNGFISTRTLAFYLATPGPTGEMAQMCFEQEFAGVISAPVTPWIDLFEEELEWRKENQS